jgi:hypothetical protein
VFLAMKQSLAHGTVFGITRLKHCAVFPETP